MRRNEKKAELETNCCWTVPRGSFTFFQIAVPLTKFKGTKKKKSETARDEVGDEAHD